MTAVYSRTAKDYTHGQNPDGSFQAQTYTLRKGGDFGGPRIDETIDNESFEDVSLALAVPLAVQGFVPSEDPHDTKLLIVVYWGTTIVPDDLNPNDTRSLKKYSEEFGGMEAVQDGKTDAQTANMLGYSEEIFHASAHDPRRRTLEEEIERDRYFVVLLAYDYRAYRKFGLRDLLWETRFSIPEAGNDFEKAFPAMAAIAGKYFGQNSHGLIHHNLDEGHVEVGAPRSLGTLPDR